MQPTTKHFLLASSGFALLGLAALASVESGAPAQPDPPPVHLQKWIQSMPNRPMPPCPLSAPAATADAPYFAFVQVPPTCLVDGPYRWKGMDWYVQRMQGLVTTEVPTPHEVIRVCSKSAIRPPTAGDFEGPCRTAKGVGPKGCELCRINGVPQ